MNYSRRRGHAGQHEHLVEAQVSYGLAEIKPRSVRDAVYAVAEIDDVDIQLQDAFLPELPLERQRDDDFRSFPQKAVGKAKIQILGQLHRDGAGAVNDFLRADIRAQSCPDLTGNISIAGIPIPVA